MVDLALSAAGARLLRLFDIFCLGMDRWRRRLVQGHYLNAEIADLAQSKIREFRNVSGHLPEHIFNRVNSVATAERLEQVAQNFPIVAGVSGWPDRAIQSLQPAFAINH